MKWKVITTENGFEVVESTEEGFDFVTALVIAQKFNFRTLGRLQGLIDKNANELQRQLSIGKTIVDAVETEQSIKSKICNGA